MSQEAPIQTETPSGEGAPEQPEGAEFDPGTPPDSNDDEGSPATPEPDETDEEGLSDSPETPSGYSKLRAKYPNLSDEEFQETVAEHYWSTTKEISSREKRIRDLEVELEARSEPEPEPEPEPVTNPQIERLDNRIKTLYDRGEGYKAEQNELLKELPAVDKEIAKCEARIEDAGDGEYADSAKVQRYESMKANLGLKRDNLIKNLRDLHYKKEQADFEMETLLADKDFLSRVAVQQREQQKIEQQDTEQFNRDFPKWVDDLTAKAATDLGAPKEQRIRESLERHVNRAVTMDFWRLANQGIHNVDVPKLVQGYVKEYLEDRDLVGRLKFQKESKEKLGVAGRKATPAPVKPPAAKRPPVPVGQLGKSETTPAMAAARKYLNSRGL